MHSRALVAVVSFSLTVCSGDEPSGRPNLAPVANAGPDQTVATGATVTLDGSASSDADGDALVFSWSFVSFAGRVSGRTPQFDDHRSIGCVLFEAKPQV